ncbi:GNAT family N-acetyltransferase [Brachybacterium tyrofermentans]|uniref:GNAT family N-acetyltransferase n=1 Tax=Brachybacterium tyrofermentans TaxID=47848 RepID=UPI003F93CE66
MISAKVLAPDDWPVWRELRLRALTEDPEAFSSTLERALARDGDGGPERETYWRGYFRLPGAAFIAVQSDGCEGISTGAGVPAGMARLLTTSTPGEPAEVLSVWVAPEHRGHGVGRALIAACVGHLAAHHPKTRLRLAVVETNRPARRLYESCGFGVIGRNPDDDTELLMERRA